MERDPLDVYLAEIETVPELSRDQEMSLIELARKGDPSAKKKLVEAHLRWAAILADLLKPDFINPIDAIQEANLVLMRLVDREDVESIGSELGNAVKAHFNSTYPEPA